MIRLKWDTPTFDSGLTADDKQLILLPLSKNGYQNLLSQNEKIQKSNSNNRIDIVYELLTCILNNNTNGIVLKKDDVSCIDIPFAVDIVKRYMEFITKMSNLPN